MCFHSWEGNASCTDGGRGEAEGEEEEEEDGEGFHTCDFNKGLRLRDELRLQ